MSENITLKVTTEAKYSLLLGQEIADDIIWTFRFVIYPSTSVIGICSNLTSIIVLTRQGLKKSSNILLLVLAVSDVLLLIGLNNFPQYIFTENIPRSFRYSETVNYMCYVILTILSIANMTGSECSMVIPVLIAGERILAIFFPLHLRSIVTPLRTWITVSAVFLLSLGFAIYLNVICVEFYEVVNERIAVGYIIYSPFYFQRINGVWVYQVIRSISNNLTGIVPIVLVSVGCVVIGIQVKIISIKRLKIISSCPQKHSQQRSGKTISKTTKSLLGVCLLFFVCSGFAYLVPFIKDVEVLQNEHELNIVLPFISNSILVINSIGNFIVYAAFNKNFRVIFKTLFPC